MGDEVIDLSGPYSNSPFVIPPTSRGTTSMFGLDSIVNKKKISNDTLSLSSGSSESGTGTDDDSGSGSKSRSSTSGTEETDDDASEIENINSFSRPNFGGSDSQMNSRIHAEKARQEAELNEKRELIYQFKRLESRGVNIPREFTINDSLDDMKTELLRIKREKEVDASIKFQRKMLVGLVTGIEFLNTKFDPFDVRLEGFSESVTEGINDYDEIFEELHDKYRSTGKKMAPELRLLMSLSGSALMFHLTNSMFKSSANPKMEEVLKNDPELMRKFQESAMKQSMGANSSTGNGGLFGMMGGLFGGGNSSPPPQAPPRPTVSASGPLRSTGQTRAPLPNAAAMAQASGIKMKGPGDVDSIINEIHGKISKSPSERFETLSADEDITSIIEEEIDGIRGSSIGSGQSRGPVRGRGGAGRGRGRTLNI